jgi:hypothetical protein
MYGTCLLLANKFYEEALFINDDKYCFKFDSHYAKVFTFDR